MNCHSRSYAKCLLRRARRRKHPSDYCDKAYMPLTDVNSLVRHTGRNPKRTGTPPADTTITPRFCQTARCRSCAGVHSTCMPSTSMLQLHTSTLVGKYRSAAVAS